MTNATGKGWWTAYLSLLGDRARDLAELEATTTAFRSFQWLYVPGLLQTPDYMRALFSTWSHETPPDIIDQYVDFRLQRQQVLSREPLPNLHAVIHEAAFHMHFVDRKIMRDQLAHLEEVSHLPNVNIQLLPFKVERHPATPGAPFTIYDAAAPELRTVYVEQPITPLFLGDPEPVGQFTSDFARMSSVSLAPLRSQESHEGSSLGLLQYLRYVL
ncbi:DUF5753 domain-containing protein [Streptomyces sp. ACA25]|uniref:DUF5753 domain-containing protein n=1 Tax=Streptomyces sp. ACA25 TaxID=3022596 RepID=UPI002306FA38|nr:DUF5753 domain-containing protein [Streptomyces sp. ACA25]MDB1090224.1 DUF5753 domain-containing protein [Streptomyces sp. ACA25]